MPIGDHADTVVGSVSENGTLIRTTVYSGVLFTEVGETRGDSWRNRICTVFTIVYYIAFCIYKETFAEIQSQNNLEFNEEVCDFILYVYNTFTFVSQEYMRSRIILRHTYFYTPLVVIVALLRLKSIFY